MSSPRLGLYDLHCPVGIGASWAHAASSRTPSILGACNARVTRLPNTLTSLPTRYARRSFTYQFDKHFLARFLAQYDSSRDRVLTDFLASYEFVPGTVFHVGYGSL
ncbi:MAG: hypothetical protein K2Y23_22285 [Cyanobacteria bacterium]|nr:hypothetical protein [Cyanobacteriota bacterium]